MPSFFQKFTSKNRVTIFIKIVHALIIMHLSTSAYAQNYDRYCFPSQASAESALNKLEFLKAPVDKIELDQNCLDILIPPHRLELYEKFISLRLPEAQRELSLIPVGEGQCNFNVTVSKMDKNNQTELNTHVPSNRFQGINSNSDQQYSLTVQEKKTGSIEINGYSLTFGCEKKGEWYSVKLQSQYSSPQNNRYPNPNLSLVLISTELLMQSGQKIQIGSMSQNKDQNSGTVQIGSSAIIMADGQNSHLIFLQLR